MLVRRAGMFVISTLGATGFVLFATWAGPLEATTVPGVVYGLDAGYSQGKGETQTCQPLTVGISL